MELWIPIMLCKIAHCRKLSQRTQIIRHVAEPPDHLGFAEIACGGVARMVKRDHANVTSLRDNASAGITTAVGLKHSVGTPAAMPSLVTIDGSAT